MALGGILLLQEFRVSLQLKGPLTSCGAAFNQLVCPQVTKYGVLASWSQSKAMEVVIHPLEALLVNELIVEVHGE